MGRVLSLQEAGACAEAPGNTEGAEFMGQEWRHGKGQPTWVTFLFCLSLCGFEQNRYSLLLMFCWLYFFFFLLNHICKVLFAIQVNPCRGSGSWCADIFREGALL